MRMSLNKVLALTFLILAGYASYYWVQSKAPGKSSPTVFKSSIDSVHAVSIITDGNPYVRLAKRGGRWYMTLPIEDMADENQMEKLLLHAKDIVKKRVVSPDVRNLAPFGLSPPRVIITLETESGQEELRLGHLTVDEKEVFVCQGESHEVFVLSKEVEGDFLLPPASFRDKQILQLDRNEIETLAIDFGDTEIGLKKSQSGYEQTVGPSHQDATKLWDEVIQDLGRTIIFDFVNVPDHEMASHGLNPPLLKVKITGPGGEQTFQFGDEGPQGFIYAKISGRPGVVLVDKPSIWMIHKGRAVTKN